MRDWASSYGAAVRQRTVRQETTMAKHGTLPEYIYQRHCISTERPINVSFVEPEEEEEEDEEEEEEEEEEEARIDESGDETEYDQS